MAAIVLTILKVTGLIILGILAFILLILAIVLFVPIRYRISADKSDPDGDLILRAKVTYLLHIVSGSFSYIKESDMSIRIFGIKIWPKNKVKVDREDTGHLTVEPEADDFTIDWNDEDVHTGPNPGKEEADTSYTYEHEDEGSSDNTESLGEKIDRMIDGIIDKYDLASEKITGIKKDIRFWDKMIHDERNKDAFHVIKAVTLKFLKKIAPRRIKRFIHFGFEDPATTGRILMYLAMLYPVMPRKLTIEPGFSDTLVYGDCDIKGRLCLITVAVCFLKLYFNKDCRRMYRLYKRHTNK